MIRLFLFLYKTVKKRTDRMGLLFIMRVIIHECLRIRMNDLDQSDVIVWRFINTMFRCIHLFRYVRAWYGRRKHPMQELIREITKEQLKTDLPAFRPGDTVRVHVKVVEGTRERIQIFEGVVIKRRGGGISETFTVRKISYNVGVERTFPVHSPKIAQIDVVRRGKVRRAKLYYLRKLRGKAARIKEIR